MMAKRALWWCLTLAAAARAAAGPPAPSHEMVFAPRKPLVPPAADWAFNDYWRTRTIGPKRFYMAAQGPYLWLNHESVARLRQVGLLDRLIPGHINFSFIKYFLPEERAKLKPDSAIRQMVEGFLEHKWPIQTIFYHRFRGNPPPSKRLV